MVFTMNVEDPQAIKQEVVQEIQSTSPELEAIVVQARESVNALFNLDVTDVSERRGVIASIADYGVASTQDVSKKNALLQTRIGSLSKSGSEGGMVAKSLTDLQRVVKELDPSLIDFDKKGLFGRVIKGVSAYFVKYEKSEDVINSIIESLKRGKQILKDDNVSLALEEDSLRQKSKKLQRDIEYGTQMDNILSAKLEEARADGTIDAERAKFFEEEVLFPLRKRLIAYNQLLLVSHQGVIAMELIQRNNRELIGAVDTALFVTVEALKTAVIVASVLYNQRIVLKKIQALNQTTNTLIDGTSRMLKEQGNEIQQLAVEGGVTVDTLKTAFANLLEVTEGVSTFKQKALPEMKKTIQVFGEMAAEGEKVVRQLERGSEVELLTAAK